MLIQVDSSPPPIDDQLVAPSLVRNGVPLYVQVAGLLRRRLEGGDWRLGEYLPAIEALTQEYRVSRVTMRQALAELEVENLVRRSQGKGTLVTRDATQERWLILPTEWNALIAHIDGLGSRAVTLVSDFSMPPPEAGRDGLAAKYWHTRRVNYTGTTPYSLTSVYLDQATHARDADAYSNGPVLPLLARRLKRSMGKAVQRLAVSTADLEVARQLQVAVGTPVVEVIRIVWDRAGRMVYVADVRYHARHLRIETILHPLPAPTDQVTRK